ncbi:MAG: hypothetical protein AMS18_03630 [Gemmatimonas sp. SG8_17]|nr:MAG: hypothetical protein AMS18_03630 [Gemmatimonas sp. SG8_17]
MVAILLGAIALLLPQSLGAQDTLFSDLLARGEAEIWYLGHSGWAVRTQHHFLIFDYWEAMQTMPPGVEYEKPADASLATGFIVPSQLSDQNVVVFVSHAHSDHYDPVILDWQESLEHIEYVFGWDGESPPHTVRIDTPRKSVVIDDVRVFTVSHDFDGIPEAAFLVQTDGVTLYHSGDHGSSPAYQQRFRDNIDYLAGIARDIDIAFTVTWGGEDYMIAQLSPKAVFPQHEGGNEHRLRSWAEQASRAGLQAAVCCAEHRGDRFVYSGGVVRR